MINLKIMESPYLHDMFKSVLLYDAMRVKQELKSQIGGKLLTEWRLVRAYQEVLGRNKEKPNPKADVIWLLANSNHSKFGYREIIHEVKTGRWDFFEVAEKYKGIKFLHSRGAITTNTPLYIWSWAKYPPHKADIYAFFHIVCNRKRENGSCRVVPLDILFPILEEKLEEIFKWKK